MHPKSLISTTFIFLSPRHVWFRVTQRVPEAARVQPDGPRRAAQQARSGFQRQLRQPPPLLTGNQAQGLPQGVAQQV